MSSACSSFVPDPDAPWLCAVCVYTEGVHHPTLASSTSDNYDGTYEADASIRAPAQAQASPQPPPKPARQFPPPRPPGPTRPPPSAGPSRAGPLPTPSTLSQSNPSSPTGPNLAYVPVLPMPSPTSHSSSALPAHSGPSGSPHPPNYSQQSHPATPPVVPPAASKPALPPKPGKPVPPAKPSSSSGPFSPRAEDPQPPQRPPKPTTAKPVMVRSLSNIGNSGAMLSPPSTPQRRPSHDPDDDTAEYPPTTLHQSQPISHTPPTQLPLRPPPRASFEDDDELEEAPPSPRPNHNEGFGSRSFTHASHQREDFGNSTFGSHRERATIDRDDEPRGVWASASTSLTQSAPVVTPLASSPSPSSVILQDSGEDRPDIASPRGGKNRRPALGLKKKPDEHKKGGLQVMKIFKKKDKLSEEGRNKLLADQQEERKRRQEDHERQLNALTSRSPSSNGRRALPARLERITVRERERERERSGTRRTYNPDEGATLAKAEPEQGPELDKTREFIIRELLSTEQTYVKNLEDTLNIFYRPMVDGAKQSPKEISLELVNTIFSNMEVILPFNRDHLLRELTLRVEEWSPSQLIGDIFARFGPFLKMYTQYNDGYDGAMKALEIASQQPWFIGFCPNKVMIESLLINPVQRIPRYSLLLEDLWRKTPSTHPDEPNLLQAIKLLRQVAAHVNLSVAKNQNFDKLTGEGLEHLLAAHRILVIDGELLITKELDHRRKRPDKVKAFYKVFKLDNYNNCQVLVFNDILVFFDKEIKDKKAIRRQEEEWPLELIWLERDPQRENGLALTGPGRTLYIDLQSPEAFERWWQTLIQAIDKQLEHTQNHLTGQLQSFTGAAESLAERQATYTFKNGLTYQGTWSRGDRHGPGMQEFMGSVYEGTFEQNKRSGPGMQQYTDGHIYVGSFFNDKPHGRGILWTPKGDWYEGDWLNGRRSGVGDVLMVSGDKYSGEWHDDQCNGTGTLAMVSGVVYTGSWLNGLFHGEGTFTTPEGTYFGDFQNGVKSGQGSMKWTGKNDSSHYEGAWKNGVMHGHGLMHDSRGQYEGEWALGVRKGRGRAVFKDGSVYDGVWEDNRRHGKGVFTDLAGYVQEYRGEWQRDVKQGRGIMIFSYGVVYDGQVYEGLPHGHGTMTSVSEEGLRIVVDSKWQRGVRDGKANIVFEDFDGSKMSYVVDDEDEWCCLPLPSYIPPFSWEH